MIPFSGRRLPAELIPWGAKGQIEIGPSSQLPPGAVIGVGDYTVINHDGNYYHAVSRSCRHLLGDLAGGTVDARGLVCPVHGARYELETGRMVSGPRGIYARIPGLGAAFKALTRVLPLTKREVIERDGVLYLR